MDFTLVKGDPSRLEEYCQVFYDSKLYDAYFADSDRLPTVLTDAMNKMCIRDSAMTMRNGVADVLGQWGITVKVTASDLLLIPKYNGTVDYQYALSLIHI